MGRAGVTQASRLWSGLVERASRPFRRRRRLPFSSSGWKIDGSIIAWPAHFNLLLSLFWLGSMMIAYAEPPVYHENSLGMRFTPVKGTAVFFSIYQTRVKDFQAFIRATGYVKMRETADSDSRMWSLDRDGQKQRGNSWADPGFAQTGDHPVVGVSWYDAKAFCEWLTLRERAAGRLPRNREYRLPTDAEWSIAVGLEEEDPKKSPQEKDGKITDKFPWGPEWPPPKGAGNYAGEEVNDGHWPANFSVIEGYNDGFPRTAPVGSFKPNQYGIFDLGSNVVEWCEDLYSRSDPYRVLRGASWNDRSRVYLLSSYRYDVLPGYRRADVGFRCVEGISSP